ncbi:response regulator [Candidatus Hydrogenedentota bacterium]
MRVLVVDDDADTNLMIVELFKLNGFDTSSACDGDDALTKMRSEDFDVVVTDLMMPGKSGLDLLKEIKNDPLLWHVPVILLTAYAYLKHMDEAARAGVAAIFSKPLDGKLLIEAVKNLPPIMRE